MVFIIWYEEQILNLVLKNGINFGLDELFLLVFLLSVFLFMISGVCQFFISGTTVSTVWVAALCLIEHSHRLWALPRRSLPSYPGGGLRMSSRVGR